MSARRDDWLIQQLPVGMLEDEFLVRFLSIFQDVANTVAHQVDTLRHMFDPDVAPPSMVRALGSWIGVHWIDSTLPAELQRRIVTEYANLLRWRGTRRGMAILLEVISGAPATVTDSGGVFGDGDAPRMAPHVRMEVESTGWASADDLVRIVRSELPASVTFQLIAGGRSIWPPSDDPGEAKPVLLEVS